MTSLSTGAGGGTWSPDGKNIVFISAVYPDCSDDACNKKRDEEVKTSTVKAKIFTHLLYRHWNTFSENKRSHLFVVSAETDAAQPQAASPRDLTPGDYDVPPFHLAGQDMSAISPDSRELAYTSNIDEIEGTSTNNEIFVVPISGGAPKKIAKSPGSDSIPRYSPDGATLAWRSMARAGYEADRAVLLLYDRKSGQTRPLTDGFDRSVESFAWSADSAGIFFVAQDHGTAPIWFMPIEGDQPREVFRAHADDLIFAPRNQLYFSRTSVSAPTEIYRVDTTSVGRGEMKSQAVPVTYMNEALLSQIEMTALETFTFKGAENADVQGFLVKPPGFDAKKKYPLKFLMQGGPQGAFGDSWSYRWNAELFAANGYVVVMINPRGSTGYGQEFY